MKLFKELTIHEQRILCHQLSNSFDCIKADVDREQCINKRNKNIQELKRRMLNVELEQYENKIEHYEHLYQQDLNALKLQILNPTSSDQKRKADILMDLVISYLHHHTNSLIRHIRFQESRLHDKLIRQRRRHLLTKKKIIDVYPQTIVDVPRVSMSLMQLNYLSCNGKLKLLLNIYFNSSTIYKYVYSYYFVY
jgi:hypothetical protein